MVVVVRRKRKVEVKKKSENQRPAGPCDVRDSDINININSLFLLNRYSQLVKHRYKYKKWQTTTPPSSPTAPS